MHLTIRPLLGITAIACLVAASHTAVRRHTVPVPTMTLTASHTVAPSAPSQSYGNLPLSFESNQGQSDSRVQFLSHGPGYSLFLTSNEAVLALHTSGFGVRGSGFGKSWQMFAGTADCKCGSSPAGVFNESRTPIPEPRVGTPIPDVILRLKLVGANLAPKTVGLEQQSGIVNYFRGKDPAKWHTHIPTYGRVEYKSVYPGIDMVYYGNQKQLEYDWVVAPGADVHQIQLAVKGATSTTLTPEGDLQLHTSCGDVVQHAPVVYQEVEGVRKTVSAKLVLLASSEGKTERRIGFAVGAYDHTHPLVIDPVLVYSTYLGGSAYDSGASIAVDGSSNAYIVGGTSSTDFPLEVPYQSTLHGPGNVSISELNATGTALIYSTYLGGSVGDSGTAITVDSMGNAYIVGGTASPDFPVKNALYPTIPNSEAGCGFVTKLAAGGGSLIYSTYLGGTGAYADYMEAVAVDSSGNAYITGDAYSADFPLKNAFQNTRKTATSSETGFVTKINPAGTALVYSTYLGGSFQDYGHGIAADSAGNAYITGRTGSTDFPVKNAMQNTLKGKANAFVTVFNPTGSALVYSTFLGGSGSDAGLCIALDSSDNVYVAGAAGSSDFPTKNAYQLTNHTPSINDGFVTKINPTGSALVYSTYLGGSGDGGGLGDYCKQIAVNSLGQACVIGNTNSPDFPTHFPLQPNYGGGGDAFVTLLNASGSGLIYSTYLGGSLEDDGNGIAVDSSNNVYVTGLTYSTDLPIQNPFQALNRAAPTQGYDGFVARIGNYNWQAVDLSVGSDNKSRLLWNIQNDSFTNWSVDSTGAITFGATTTPASGTSVQSISAGADAITRILGNNTDSTATLWLANANNTLTNSSSFGPYSGWSAVDVTVGSDNKSRLLWNKSDGTAGVWTVSNTGGTSNLENYGPNAGWTATRIAAGADGLTRLLWTKTDGSAAIWILNANNTYKTGSTFGPFTGWRAIDLSVDSDNKARLLWVKSDNTAGVWTVDNSGVTTNLTNFGPYTGWTATKLASGGDGLSRLLWFKGDGTQAIWLLNANNSYNAATSFGPY